MKAWTVGEKDEFGGTVVFAETANKARYLAQWTDACRDVDYVRIVARRSKDADKYWEKGKLELDWLNPKDRVVMVKELGFRCEHIDNCMCAECAAAEWCDAWQEAQNCD